MAMSKRCFLLLFLVVLIALGGGVAIVVLVMNKTIGGDGKSNSELNPTTDKPLAKKSFNTISECQSLLSGGGRPVKFTAKIGESKIATRQSIVRSTGFQVLRNAYWLTGDRTQDVNTLKQIELSACQNRIPVVIIKMRPNEGLQVHHGNQDWEHYKPKSVVDVWKDYDRALERALKVLSRFPSLVILEPDLLMYTFDSENQQFRWKNSKYEEEFLKRAQRTIRRLKSSWVYVDAGNAAYLSDTKNLEQMALTLLRLSDLRGFAINTLHYVNRTYNEWIARKLHCRTGLHYVVDTSRNGGPFSMQALRNIEKCLFDPPNMGTGQKPGWSWGSRKQSTRTKRWIHQYGSQQRSGQQSQGQQMPLQSDQERYNNFINNQNNVHDNNNNQANRNNFYQANNNNNNNQNNRQNPSAGSSHRIFSTDVAKTTKSSSVKLRSTSEASRIMRSFANKLRFCVSKPTFMTAHDASVWLKTPGESDGRLYSYGSLHSCLVGHNIPCDDSCQMIHNFASNRGSSLSCRCESKRSQTASSNTNSAENFNFPSFPFNDNKR